MKAFLIIILILIPSIAFTQSRNVAEIYLNGKRVNFDYTFVNPNIIKSVQVKRKTPSGELYITTETEKWKYKSLAEFIKPLCDYSQIMDKSNTPIYIIDKKVIDYPDSVQIDSSYFGEVTLKSLSSVNGVGDCCKKLIIVNIDLLKEFRIHLRGNSLPYLDSLKNK